VKGFLACILEALSRVSLTRLARPLAIVLTSDEEVGCTGAKFLVAKHAIEARHMIIGEPTGLTPVRAGKGYGLAEIVVRGKEAHSAFPELGRSAIRDAARVIEALDNVASELASLEDFNFDPPFTTLNVGLIQGGAAKNIVPGECRRMIEWRPIPGQDTAWAATLVQVKLQDLKRGFPGLDAELQIQRVDPAFDRSGSSELISVFESLTNRVSTTVAFGTEAAHLASLASQVMVFGPGNMSVAHKTGEFVSVEELNGCVNYLVTAIEQLCGQPH
jgi:acetylornithine deacetylase